MLYNSQLLLLGNSKKVKTDLRHFLFTNGFPIKSSTPNPLFQEIPNQKNLEWLYVSKTIS
jgi:hypothetical protein